MSETLTATDEAISPTLYLEVTQFLYREAELLDEHRYEEWLGLLTEDIVYEMPVTLSRERTEQGRIYDPQMRHMAETFNSLKTRVDRLGTEYAWAEDPPTRSRHMISNVIVEPTDRPNELDVRSAFSVYANRGDRPSWDHLLGRREDTLRGEPGRWRIAKRRLLLDEAVVGIGTISIFL